MRISRRKVLVGGASMCALAGCETKPAGGDTGTDTAPERSAEPDPWVPEGEEDLQSFAWGVQIGDATPSGAILSVRSAEAELVVVLAVADGSGWTEVERQEGLVPADGVLQLELTGLDADTAYTVAVYASDLSRRAPVARFRTALADDGWRVVTLGASCCFGGNEPWPSLSFAAEERLDCFVLLGDTIYADNDPDAYDYEAKWSTALSTEGMRLLTASTSVIGAWDDHEVDNNWSWEAEGIDERHALAFDAFQRALPMSVGPGGNGLWRKLSWGRVVDLFVLDCRGERRDSNYISVEQMDWLKAGLSASTARFKFILNTVPITDYMAFFGDTEIEDRWSGYPTQREEILAHINSIPGVLWIAGDLHMAQVGRVDPVGGTGADQWEVLAGPGGSFLNVLAEMFVGDAQYPILFAQWNWTRFRCDPAAGTVEVTFIGDDGATIEEIVLEI